MRKLTSILVLVTVFLWSCEKGSLKEEKEFTGMAALRHNSYAILDSRLGPTGLPELTISKNGVAGEESVARLFCKETVLDLVAGQTIPAGNIIVSNDMENLYVTYKSGDGWKIKEIHLFAGTFADIPLNNANVPVPGQFPIKESFDPAIETVTYEIPLSELPVCPYILAHAVVVKEGQEETAWGKGDVSFEEAFDIKRWGWVIEFCPEKCEDKEIVVGLKSYVVDPKVYDPETDVHVGWVVTKGAASTVNCLGLGFNTFDTNQENSSVFDLIKWGNLDTKWGTMSVFTSIENNIKYLNVVIDLDNDDLAFSHSYLYVGSTDGLKNYYYVYENKDCFKFYEWFYQDTNILNTKTFKIPLKDIKEK